MAHTRYTIRHTIRHYASGSNVLILATILALIIANLPVVSELYFKLWELPVTLEIGDFNLFSVHGKPMSLGQFINDALMVLFFFTVGLEIKREFLVGELSSPRQAILPIIGACGGMIVPVIIFFLLGHGTDYVRGCAIPMATDIAFSLGALSLLGRRVPISLKVFLTTLAVVDDLGGILVIAIFYSNDLNLMFLLFSLAPLLILIQGAFFKVQSKLFYFIFGALMWYCFVRSGIHPTIAGVIVAFCIPAKPLSNPAWYLAKIRRRISNFPATEDEKLQSTVLSKEQIDWLKEIESASDKVISPLQDLEDTLNPFVNYIIIPLFAFANAGISLQGMQLSSVYSGVALAVICGLVIGKFLGIFSFSWFIIKMGWAAMPTRSNYTQLAGVCMMGGIGFTVSLFIATLSFGSGANYDLAFLNDAKLGIIIGSVLSGFLGYIYLNKILPKTSAQQAEA